MAGVVVTPQRQARVRGALPGSARVVHRLAPAAGRIALTFDDGPEPDGTPAVLAALATANASATFFVLADAVRRNPSLLRDAVAAGHSIGLHADVHERLDRLPTAVLTDRLRDAREAVENVAGVPVVLHRPPFGRLSLRGARAARRAGLRTVVMWSHDPLDWDLAQTTPLAERLRASLEPGAIVLLHDGSGGAAQGAATAAAVAAVLPELADRGLAPVGVAG
jgi:peptidoglycan/xylan/chitin deacetylase (PgdA/CDA1 family)